MNIHMARDVKELIRSLNSYDDKIRADAAKSISSLAKKGTSDVESIKPLISLLSDRNGIVRKNAAEALKVLQEKDIVRINEGGQIICNQGFHYPAHQFRKK